MTLSGQPFHSVRTMSYYTISVWNHNQLVKTDAAADRAEASEYVRRYLISVGLLPSQARGQRTPDGKSVNIKHPRKYGLRLELRRFNETEAKVRA